MKNELITALARLASLPFQRRYIIGGTVDTYFLPEELLEDVDGLVRRAKRAENSTQFSDVQMCALEALFRFIHEHSGEALECSSREDFFDKLLNGTRWSELRSKASAALAEFGLHIDTISVDEIDKGKWP
jgi:hypothetical protein